MKADPRAVNGFSRRGIGALKEKFLYKIVITCGSDVEPIVIIIKTKNNDDNLPFRILATQSPLTGRNSAPTIIGTS
jgi:hypothetical protein